MLAEIIVKAALYAIPLLFAVVAHEVAHGWTAEKLGDPTARRMGRITLNPLVHIDLVGTIILPIVLLLMHSPFLFGWAKPVPVQFANLRGGRRSMALVALSGPATNFLMASLSAVLFHLLGSSAVAGWEPGGGWSLDPLRRVVAISIEFNLVLMVINMLPIPPLDGGRVLIGLLPAPLASVVERLEAFGMLIVLALIGTGAWGYIIHPVLKVFLRLFLG